MTVRTSTRERVNGIAALAVLAVIVVGVPVVLIAVARWPLPESMPDWGRVRRAVGQGDVPAEVVVNVLAVIVWLIWAQVIWALLWELAVNVPRLASGRRSRRAPLVTASVGNGIGRLVAMALAVGTVVATTPAPAVALPSSPSGAFMPLPAAAPAVQAEAAHDAAPERAVHSPRWKVDRSDSLWRIAETALGDGERAGEILEHNTWLGSPRHLKAGQVLTLPHDAAVPDDRQPAPPTPAADPAPPDDAPSAGVGYLPATQVVIEPGDTLWDLAEQRLATVDDDVTPSATLAYVNDVIAANPDVVEDPNLIYPGEVFSFPAVGTTTPAPTSAPTVTEPPDEPAQHGGPATVPTDLPSGTEPTPEPEPAGPTAAPSTSLAPPAMPTVAVPVTTAPVNNQAAPPSPPTTVTTPTVAAHTGAQASNLVRLGGITGAIVVASGILVAYRRRLNVRAARGASAYRASIPDDPSVLAAVTRASDVSLLRWANAALGDVMARLAPADIAGQPLAVELSDTDGIELLWTEPNPTAPSPWTATSEGWAWQLAYDTDAPVDNTDRPAAIPALVTVGRRHGRQLLVNLEAVGTLTVDGDDQPAADLVRSLVAELAVGEIVSDAYLVTTGIDIDALDAGDRVQPRSRDEARLLLAAAIDASAGFLSEHHIATAFHARLGGDDAGREATVVVVDDEYATPLHEGVVAGLNACLVYTGAVTDGTCIRIGADGLAVLEPYGIEFEPAALPASTVTAVGNLLSDANEPYEPPPPSSGDDTDAETVTAIGNLLTDANEPYEPPPPSSGDDTDAEPDDTATCVEDPGEDLGDDDDWTQPDPAVVVRILGAPEVIDVKFGRIETSILAYLACHGGKRRDEQVINAVWNGRAVEPKTLWNRISKIRAVLGPELVPTRMPNSTNVVLSERVMTDLDILTRLRARAGHVAEAEALQLLLQGLDLIDGVPFDSAEYEWSFETQDHAAACEIVEAATLDCVEIAMNLGDLVAARHAVTQGLRALPLNEPLYRARMRIEAASGNPDGVRQALGELTTALDGANGIGDCTPTAETIRTAEQLAASH